MNSCLFCKIVNQEISAKFVYESESIVAFPDINPASDVHILILPKKHISGVEDLEEKDSQLLAGIYSVVNKLVKQYNLRNSLYRVVVNGGKAQRVPHLHFHLLGGNWKKFI